MTGLVLIGAWIVWGLLYSGRDLFKGVAEVIADEVRMAVKKHE